MTLGAAAAALAACAFYLPHLATGFASEDFLILARLSRRGLIATLREELVSPWLGLVAVGFWRPVSTFLLGLELTLFGLHPARFHAAHLVVHAFNAWLVARIVTEVVSTRWDTRAEGPPPRWIAIAAAALFAIHPFHPSAVLFTGAFATLFGATFTLLAICSFLAARSSSDNEPPDAGGRRWRLDLAALTCFALALGCYEATVVLPAVLAVLALLVLSPVSRARERSNRSAGVRSLRPTLPFFVIAGLYLLARTMILGASLGGYAAFRERYLSAPTALIAGFAGAVSRILHPWFEAGGRGGWVWLAGIAAAVVGGALASTRLARVALWGLVAAALFLAPFAFVGLVPANGRYAYLAVAGAVLALCSLGASIAVRWRRAGALLVAVASIAVALDWLIPLRRYLGAYDEATALVAAVRADLIGADATHERDDVVLLVDDPPDFIKGDAGEPIAKVLQYGLAESVRSPFGPLTRAPIPLPFAVSPSARAALDELAGTVRYRWDANADRLMPLAPESPPPTPTLEIQSYDASTGCLETDCHDCAATRLVLLTSSLPVVMTPIEVAAGRARFELSSDLLRGSSQLDDGDAFFWVEEPAGISPIARLSLRGDVARNLAEAAAKIRRDQNGANPR